MEEPALNTREALLARAEGAAARSDPVARRPATWSRSRRASAASARAPTRRSTWPPAPATRSARVEENRRHRLRRCSASTRSSWLSTGRCTRRRCTGRTRRGAASTGTGSGATSRGCRCSRCPRTACRSRSHARDGARALAVLHAGWRGLAEGIVAAGVAALGGGRKGGRSSGPAIGPCCYEVGDEVAALFDADLTVERRLDLWAAAERALRAPGVETVERVDLCTRCHPELFFSHRRSGRARGAQGVIGAVAWLRFARASTSAGRGRTGGDRRCSDQIRVARRHGAAPRGRHHRRGREPGAGPRGEACRVRRRVPWHFIGHLQSNKVKVVNRICTLSTRSTRESAARRLEVPALVQVNLSGEPSKSGIEPDEIPSLAGLRRARPVDDAARCDDPGGLAGVVCRLRGLARDHGLAELSMGTTQDYLVAAEEGATHVRVGSGPLSRLGFSRSMALGDSGAGRSSTSASPRRRTTGTTRTASPPRRGSSRATASGRTCAG